MKAVKYTTEGCDSDHNNYYKSTDITSLAVGFAIVMVIIILVYTTSRVTQAESDNADGVNDILEAVQKFHLAPSREAFTAILDSRKTLPLVVAHYLKHWTWGIESIHPEYLSVQHRQLLDLWRPAIVHDIHVAKSNTPTREALRGIWYIYFATGDQQYAEIIRRAAVNTQCSRLVQGYARSTYEGMMKRDYNIPIRGTALDITTSPDTHSITPTKPTAPSTSTVINTPVYCHTSSTDSTQVPAVVVK